MPKNSGKINFSELKFEKVLPDKLSRRNKKIAKFKWVIVSLEQSGKYWDPLKIYL